MARAKQVIETLKYHPDQRIKSLCGNLKAARMFLSVAAGHRAGNNGRWEQTLQNFSDYLICY